MKKILFILSIVLLFCSCETEIDLLLPPDSTPLVYSILDLSDTLLEVRLSKSFQMESAFETDLIPIDSLILPGARIWAERWNGDYLFSRNELIATERPRVDGIFPVSPNQVYVLPKTFDQNRIFETYNKGDRIKLLVEIPDEPLVFAMIQPFNKSPISRPSRDGVRVSLYRVDKPYEVTWRTYAYYSEGYLEITVAERYENSIDTVKYAWREYHSIPDTVTRRPKDHNFYLKAPKIFERISANVKPNPNILYRHVIDFKIVTYSTDKYLYDYNRAHSQGIVDHSGIPFSNIVNGMGLFASANKAERSFTLDYRSMDSLANSRFTKDLKFRNW